MGQRLRLGEIYNKVCSALGWQPRRLIMETLKELDNAVRSSDGGAVLVRAPTGYGKSTISLTLYVAIKQFGRTDLGFRVIHALPMRSIGDKMEIDMRGRIEALIDRGFDKLSPNDLGLQHMGSPGSPYLARRFVITTGDTLISSLYKVPPVEIRKIFLYNISHYEIPRGFIYSSVVVFDEFHLYPRPYLWSASNSEQGDKALTSMLAAVKAILDSGSPVVIATATLPKPVLDALNSVQGLRGRIFEIPGSSDNPVSRDVGVYLESVRDRDTMIAVIAEKALELSIKGSVLVVLNTVESAARVYSNIKDLLKARGSVDRVDLMLIHGRIVERDRKSIVEKLSRVSAKNQPVGRILVSTQVLEAGVDVSFNYLLTEIAPPESIIQRLGRVARYGGYGEAYIYIIVGASDPVPIYPAEILEEVVKELEAIAKSSGGALSHRDVEGLLRIYDRIENPNIIMRDYGRALDAIDRSMDISSIDVKGVLEKICSFLRDSDLVRLLPAELDEVASCLERGLSDRSLSDISIPAERSILGRLCTGKRIIGIYTDSGKCIKIDAGKDLEDMVGKICRSNCPSIEMMKTHKYVSEPVSGLIVKGYDKEKGLVL